MNYTHPASINHHSLMEFNMFWKPQLHIQTHVYEQITYATITPNTYSNLQVFHNENRISIMLIIKQHNSSKGENPIGG